MEDRLFWQTYTKHSLGIPWVMTPIGETAPDQPAEEVGPTPIAQPYVFIANQLDQTPALKKMMERMILALKKDSTSVHTKYVASADDMIQWIHQLESTKNIIVFGSALFPEDMHALGKWYGFNDHKLMLTHDLKALKLQPQLKKETWHHLQVFVGMK